jgi:hypothetical protein
MLTAITGLSMAISRELFLLSLTYDSWLKNDSQTSIGIPEALKIDIDADDNDGLVLSSSNRHAIGSV